MLPIAGEMDITLFPVNDKEGAALAFINKGLGGKGSPLALRADEPMISYF